MRTLRFSLLALALVGCAPLVGGGLSASSLLVVLLAVVPLLLAGCATDRTPVQSTPAVGSHAVGGPESGPPPPPPTCTGSWHNECVSGSIKAHCCPKNTKCNYRFAPYTNCGHGMCVQGKDPGMCPTLEPRLTAPVGTPKDKCKFGWHQQACVSGKVRGACVGVPHTNYTGPPINPAFKTCWEDDCTTSRFASFCMPTKEKLGKKKCKGIWQEACVRGKAEKRCFPEPPTNFSGNLYPATTFVDCGKGRCAIGANTSACVR